MSITIVNTTGLATGTKVFNEDGAEIKNIKAIAIHPIEPDGMVSATITFDLVELGIKVNPKNE